MSSTLATLKETDTKNQNILNAFPAISHISLYWPKSYHEYRRDLRQCVDDRGDSEKRIGIGNFHPINLGYSESNTNFVPTPLA